MPGQEATKELMGNTEHDGFSGGVNLVYDSARAQQVLAAGNTKQYNI